MAKVVFLLTTAQVANLVEIAKRGERRDWADWGSASALVAKGWARHVPNKSESYLREKLKLTKRGRIVLALVRELKLDKIPAKPEPAAES